MSEDDDEERNELTLRRSLFEESDLLFSNQQPSSTTVCRLAANPTNPSPPERVTTFTNTASKKTTKKTKKKKTNDDKEEVQQQQQQQQQNPNNNEKSSRSSMENELVVKVACKVYAFGRKRVASCLNAKEVFVEKGDEMASRFCQKCTKFHGVDMFEGGRKACKMSLKKVQEKNKVIFAKQKMLLKEWEEAMTRRTTTTTTTTTAVKRSTKAKKEKKKTKSQENLSEGSKDRNTITTSDTQTMNNRKTIILKPCTMDSLYSTDEGHESKAAAAGAPIVTKTMGRDQQQSWPAIVAVNRVDRLLEAIKAEKRKESLLGLNLVKRRKRGEEEDEDLVMAAAREEEGRREEEEEEEEEGIDDPMEGEEGEDDDERKEHTVHAKKPSKIKKLPSLVSNILVRSITPTLSGVVRSITPTLYREAMESKLNEFRGLSSKLSPPPPPKD
ncbi:unnamed protein product [Bathycoccus prasinos]